MENLHPIVGAAGSRPPGPHSPHGHRHRVLRLQERRWSGNFVQGGDIGVSYSSGTVFEAFRYTEWGTSRGRSDGSNPQLGHKALYRSATNPEKRQPFDSGE